MGNEGGLRPWVNFIWLPPDFRVIICDGNGIISPARETRFKYDHIFSHPIGGCLLWKNFVDSWFVKNDEILIYRVIFFKWGKVLRHQILVMTFQDEPKLVYSCKLLDIYFSRKKKYFWQILLIFLSNPKFQENQCFFMKLLIWMKLKLQNFSKKLFWIKTRVEISKLVIKVNWHSTFWPK